MTSFIILKFKMTLQIYRQRRTWYLSVQVSFMSKNTRNQIDLDVKCLKNLSFIREQDAHSILKPSIFWFSGRWSCIYIFLYKISMAAMVIIRTTVRTTLNSPKTWRLQMEFYYIYMQSSFRGKFIRNCCRVTSDDLRWWAKTDMSQKSKFWLSKPHWWPW